MIWNIIGTIPTYKIGRYYRELLALHPVIQIGTFIYHAFVVPMWLYWSILIQDLCLKQHIRGLQNDY